MNSYKIQNNNMFGLGCCYEKKVSAIFQRYSLVWFMVLNATFNNISDISWRSVLLVEETGISREDQRLVPSHWHTLSHNVASSRPRHERGSNSQQLLLKPLSTLQNCQNTNIPDQKKLMYLRC